MTERKNWKDRIRERMRKTGESYTAARRHLEEERRRLEGDLDEDAATDVAMAAEGLDEREVRALEARLAKAPDDLGARTKLLGYWFSRAFGAGEEGRPAVAPEALAARAPHVEWVVRHRPESPVAGLPFADAVGDDALGERLEALWRAHVAARSEDAAVLRNAARFFGPRDRAKAVDLLRRASALEPPGAEGIFELAQDLLHAGKPAEALREVEEALASGPSDADRFYFLEPLAARAALAAGDRTLARRRAEEHLRSAERFGRDDWNHGNAIHDANEVLGSAALEEGDLEGARRHLLAAAVGNAGSPQLDSFGPGLALARGLLARGEREAVATYLEAVARFWESGREKVLAWLVAIRAGETPVLKG